MASSPASREPTNQSSQESTGLLLSPSSSIAVKTGEAYRQSVDASLYFTEFLLIGLAQKTGGSTKFLLQANKINSIGAIWQDLEDEPGLRWQKPPGFSPVSPSTNAVDANLVSLYSDNMRQVVDVAEKQAVAKGAGVIRERHLLYGLLSVDCQARRWLENAGVNVAKGHLILETIAEEKGVTADVFSLYNPNPAINDLDAKEDKLGFATPANALAQTLLRPETVSPLVVGIYGEWGSGKTSYMNLVQSYLDNSGKNIICINYNAWEYTDSEKLWAGLVHTIAKRLDEAQGKERYYFHFDKQLLLKRIRWLFFILLLLAVLGTLLFLISEPEARVGTATGITAVFIMVAILMMGQLQKSLADTIQALLKKYPQAEPEGIMHQIRKKLHTAVDDFESQAVDGDKYKVFIFIDNLDRCQLEDIPDILEGINIFLSKSIFYVFLGVDTRVLSEAIRMRYKDSKNEQLTREYIEKIVQFPVQVPRARLSGLVDFVDTQMNIAETDADKTERRAILINELQATQTIPGAPSKSMTEELGKRIEPIPDTAVEQETLVRFADKYLEGNPRRVKRLLNTYRYVKIVCEWMTTEKIDDPEWQKKMISWLGFTLRWPSFVANGLQKAVEPANQGVDDFWQVAEMRFVGEDRPSAEEIEKLPLTTTEAMRFANLAGHFLAENPVNELSNGPKKSAN